MKRLRLLHAIHDFLPRHQAGSEIYAYELAREQARRHDVFVVAAEYDPAVAHGTIRWRAYDGLPVIEIVNNWEFAGFDETYSSARVNRQFEHVLDATEPDVLHVHNLLNLSFDVPRLARERGIPVVATLHDYTLVCPSGGQRLHIADEHVCASIDTDRCSRCFSESPFGARFAAGRVQRQFRRVPVLKWAAAVTRQVPGLSRQAVAVGAGRPTPADMQRRLAYSRHVFDSFDRCVAPSAALADEYIRLGLPRERVEVSDYGFRTFPGPARSQSDVVRFGFVGTLVWHKGAHQFLDALALIRGPFRATLFGDPAVSPAYTADLRRRLDGLPARLAGPFDRTRASEIYADIDVLVVPSLWPENSPLVIHEAFMYGAAVVASRMGGIPELVTDGVNGFLFNPTDASALAATLQRFVDDPALGSRMATRAPRVKPIDEDACEWEGRYQAVTEPKEAAAPV